MNEDTIPRGREGFGWCARQGGMYLAIAMRALSGQCNEPIFVFLASRQHFLVSKIFSRELLAMRHIRRSTYKCSSSLGKVRFKFSVCTTQATQIKWRLFDCYSKTFHHFHILTREPGLERSQDLNHLAIHIC
jgi:hypothetical protein